jgi:uncharacterized protein YjbI with pentapeptide repeats
MKYIFIALINLFIMNSALANQRYDFLNWETNEVLFSSEGETKAEAFVNYLDSARQARSANAKIVIRDIHLDRVDFMRGEEDRNAINLYDVTFENALIENCTFSNSNVMLMKIKNSRVINNNFAGFLFRVKIEDSDFYHNNFLPQGIEGGDTIIANWTFENVNKDKNALASQGLIPELQGIEDRILDATKNVFFKVNLKNLAIINSNFIGTSLKSSSIDDAHFHNSSFENASFQGSVFNRLKISGYTDFSGLQGGIPRFNRID